MVKPETSRKSRAGGSHHFHFILPTLMTETAGLSVIVFLAVGRLLAADSLTIDAPFGDIRIISAPLGTPESVTECAEDICVIKKLSEGDYYICRETERPESKVLEIEIRRGQKAIPVEAGNLFNIDSSHQHTRAFRTFTYGSKSYLIAELGPDSCRYRVVWAPKRGTYTLCGQFASPIEYDIYSEKKHLIGKIGGICGKK